MAAKRIRDDDSWISSVSDKRSRNHDYSSKSRWSYNVFLSFRGEDTRRNFTDHLYTALIQKGIHTFRDDDELRRGQNLSVELLKAIEESRISIIVFSRNFASSRWCLEEVVKIMECKERVGQLVIPIFYNVDPSHVRHQTGPFAEAFAIHDEKEKVERWRSALTNAANLSGWDLQNVADGHESKFIQKIVEEVSCEVNRIPLHVAHHLVGVDYRVRDVDAMLSTGSNDVRIVGIYGMGGIGKTTIAKAVYNHLCHQFESCCFLANVREVAEKDNGMAFLQKQLLSDLLRTKNMEVRNPHEGIALIEERLRRKRVLIVLDDLNELSQLNSLAGEREWFGSGSRIIITTRNEHLSKIADRRYGVQPLTDIESLKLFSWHAFKSETIPSEKYVELANSIVSYCGGLPLAIEVLGSSLRGKDHVEQWRFTLEKLQQIPHKDILKVLRISFDALDDDTVKNIFLDISCFFVGMDKDYVNIILKGCGFFSECGIDILKDRCLLKINGGNELWMHDLLRDMGREIIRQESPEPGKRSRLWLEDDVLDVLKNRKGTEAVKGLVLAISSPNALRLSTKAFAKMHGLRFLKINNANLKGNYKYLSKELRWLCWHGCPLKRLPSTFNLDKLVTLDLRGSDFKIVWGDTKCLKSLKILNLSFCKGLTKTPDFTGQPVLERLLFEGCTNLSEVDPSVGHLDRLVMLNLSQCHNLRHLPNSICNARSLELLDLWGCSNLESLPEQLGSMERLTFLRADDTSIKRLPSSIVLLKNLTMLSLECCKNLRHLPNSICNARSLTHLDLLGCSNLESLPEQLGSMERLTVLHAYDTSIKRLPSSIGLLKNLTRLSLEYCKNLRHLPNSICNARSLKHLDLSRCSNLESLPEQLGSMERLTDLGAGFTSIKRLPSSIVLLKNLTTLCLENCNLCENDIPVDLGSLSSLEVLVLSGNKFCSLPFNLGQMKKLRRLGLTKCTNLQLLQELPGSLDSVFASYCTSLEKISISSNAEISYLYLQGCEMLSEIEGLEYVRLGLTKLMGCNNMVIGPKLTPFTGLSGNVFLSGRELPGRFPQEESGSSISFQVPFDWELNYIGIVIGVVFSVHETFFSGVSITIVNETTGLGYPIPCREFMLAGDYKDVVWLCFVPDSRCPFRGGQQIHVSFEPRHAPPLLNINKCGIFPLRK